MMSSPTLASVSPQDYAKVETVVSNDETGAVTHMNITLDQSNAIPGQTIEVQSQSPTSEVEGVSKPTRSWRKLATAVHRRQSLQQLYEDRDSDVPKSTDQSTHQSLPSASTTIPSLPEIMQRQSLTDEFSLPPLSVHKHAMQQPNIPKKCHQCGKRKRPSTTSQQPAKTQNFSTPHMMTLPVIREAPAESKPLASPTGLSDASTLPVSESPSNDSQAPEISKILSIDAASDFDICHLVPEEKMYAVSSTTGLSFGAEAPQMRKESNSETLFTDDDTSDMTASLPSTAALEDILRNMQDLLDRTSIRSHCSMSSYDPRASAIPRELV